LLRITGMWVLTAAMVSSSRAIPRRSWRKRMENLFLKTHHSGGSGQYCGGALAWPHLALAAFLPAAGPPVLARGLFILRCCHSRA
jgi:hypothetical protein